MVYKVDFDILDYSVLNFHLSESFGGWDMVMELFVHLPFEGWDMVVELLVQLSVGGIDILMELFAHFVVFVDFGHKLPNCLYFVQNLLLEVLSLNKIINKINYLN